MNDLSRVAAVDLPDGCAIIVLTDCWRCRRKNVPHYQPDPRSGFTACVECLREQRQVRHHNRRDRARLEARALFLSVLTPEEQVEVARENEVIDAWRARERAAGRQRR